MPASADTVETEGRQMKQCWIQYIEKKIQKNPPVIYPQMSYMHGVRVSGMLAMVNICSFFFTKELF